MKIGAYVHYVAKNHILIYVLSNIFKGAYDYLFFATMARLMIRGEYVARCIRARLAKTFSRRWLMNFAEVLDERYRYTFSDSVCYISVRSIESEYNYATGKSTGRPGAVFAQWIINEEQTHHPTAIAVYNFIKMNPQKRKMSSAEKSMRRSELARMPLDKKLEFLIQGDPSTQAVFLHPMYAIMFATSLSVPFAIETIGHISGLRVTGCESDNSPGARATEIIDERDAIITEMSQKIEARDRRIATLEADIRAANLELTVAYQENDRQSLLLDRVRESRKCSISLICAKICNRGRSKRIVPINDAGILQSDALYVREIR